MPDPAPTILRPAESGLRAHRARVGLLTVLAAVIVVLAGLLSAPGASAATLLQAHNAVGVIGHTGGQVVDAHETFLAGQSRARAPNYDRSVVGSCVGAEDPTGATDPSGLSPGPGYVQIGVLTLSRNYNPYVRQVQAGYEKAMASPDLPRGAFGQVLPITEVTALDDVCLSTTIGQPPCGRALSMELTIGRCEFFNTELAGALGAAVGVASGVGGGDDDDVDVPTDPGQALLGQVLNGDVAAEGYQLSELAGTPASELESPTEETTQAYQDPTYLHPAAVDKLFGEDGGVTFGAHEAGPLSESVAATFGGGSYTERVLQSDTTLYRVYGGKAGPIGSYWSRTAPSGALQAQIDGAINPAWGNTIERVATANVPAGTTIYEGAAGTQSLAGGGSLLGGGSQVYIPNVDPAWVTP